MLKKIKEYLTLRKLYHDSKKVLVINAAESIASFKNIVSMLEDFIETQSDALDSISQEDISKVKQFMNEKGW